MLRGVKGCGGEGADSVAAESHLLGILFDRNM